MNISKNNNLSVIRHTLEILQEITMKYPIVNTNILGYFHKFAFTKRTRSWLIMNMTIDDILNREKRQTYDCKSFVNVPVNVPVNLTETQRKAIEIIKSNLQITHRGLALMMSVSDKTARRTTKALC